MVATFAQWGRLVTASLEMAQTGWRFGEMMMAAKDVVGDRTSMLQAAAVSPLTGDYAELGRLVPEKVEAFSKAGSDVVAEWWAMQRDIAVHIQHVGSILLSGQAPDLYELSTLASRTAEHATRMMVRSMGVGEVALAPIHARATSNARRLGKRRKRR
jgi:hypothetical protein